MKTNPIRFFNSPRNKFIDTEKTYFDTRLKQETTKQGIKSDYKAGEGKKKTTPSRYLLIKRVLKFDNQLSTKLLNFALDR